MASVKLSIMYHLLGKFSIVMKGHCLQGILEFLPAPTPLLTRLIVPPFAHRGAGVGVGCHPLANESTIFPR